MADLDAFDRFEAVGWETTAAAYDHYWPRLTNRLNDHLLDAVGAGPHARLLDVACGPGYLAGQATDRAATVTGIDVAEAMVEIARRRYPRIEFRQADAQALPFPEASFHAIVGNLAIPHLARPERAAAEFHRVLASNGRLALTTWDLPDRARLVGVLLEAVREIEVIPPETVPAGPDFFRFADNAEFNALLAGQGFTEVEVRSIAFITPSAARTSCGTASCAARCGPRPSSAASPTMSSPAYGPGSTAGCRPTAPDGPTKSRLPSSWPPGDRADYHRLNCTRAADRQLAGGFVIDSN